MNLQDLKKKEPEELLKQAEKVLKITYLEAKLFKSNMIGTEHLLLSILLYVNEFVFNYIIVRYYCFLIMWNIKSF